MSDYTKKFIKLVSILFTLLFLNTNIYADEKYIGFIESLNGDAFKISDGKKVKLNEFDQVFVGSEITTESNSSTTISYLDNSILTLNNATNFNNIHIIFILRNRFRYSNTDG